VPNTTAPVKVSWVHTSGRAHQFTINNLLRGTISNKLHVTWDGNPLDVDKKDGEDFEIPEVGDFKVMSIKAVNDHEQYVLVYFSNPVKIGQELNGLTTIAGHNDVAYTIDGSTVKLYATEQLEGNKVVTINDGVTDINNKKVLRAYTANVFFENRMPSVTIPGKSVILPSSGRLTMPFEAVNLSAVDVSIIKIYENNVPQYFQNNGFDGGYELRHVGKPIVKKTIRLDADKGLNLAKKNRFMLDVDQLMRAEPGAIYRVIIGFRKEYSLYNCSAGKLMSQ
jgi:hypothetical protein